MRILNGLLIFGLASLVYSQAVQMDTMQKIIGEQSESIAALEQSNKVLRLDLAEVTEERDVAVKDLGAAKAAFVISRGAKRIARVVNAEANNQPELGQMLVARVVMNRVQANPGMGVDDIIDNKNAFADSSTYTAENMDAVLEAALDRQYHGVFTFFNPETATNQDFVRRKMKDAVLEVGDHVFCQ